MEGEGEGSRGGHGQVTNRLIVWRAAVLSRRAVPERSGVVALARGSGETTRGRAPPSGCFCRAGSSSWDGRTQIRGLGTDRLSRKYVGITQQTVAGDYCQNCMSPLKKA
jgi:hypothetical protein